LINGICIFLARPPPQKTLSCQDDHFRELKRKEAVI
jgi:hypothetical protein